MGEVSTIGLDIAKSVFQIHGVDAGGAVVIRRRITRGKLLEFFAALPPCLIGIEACPTAHYWSRRLQALGHNVRLLPPSYVKAYLKRSKNDANDAAAICEAVTRPSMRFVRVSVDILLAGSTACSACRAVFRRDWARRWAISSVRQSGAMRHSTAGEGTGSTSRCYRERGTRVFRVHAQ